MAAVLSGICLKSSKTHGVTVIRPCVVAANFSTTSSKRTTAEHSKNPLFDPKLSALKRGTGGRSSFNGMVASVFGATGFVGRAVMNRLGKIGTQMIVPYRGDEYFLTPLKLCGDLGQVLFFPYHLQDEESIRKAMKHSNVVINMVGRDWETKNFRFKDVHVDGARRIARIARETGIKRLIHFSALNAYPKAKGIIVPGGSEFLKSKYQGELAVKEEFPDATIIRPGWTYGQGDRFLFPYGHLWRQSFNSFPLWEKGENTIKAPLYVGDLAGAVVNALKDSDTVGKTLEICGPKRYRLSDLADYMLAITRRDETIGVNVKRTNMKWDFPFRLRVTLTEKFCPSWPVAFLTWDKLEQEHTTDEMTGKPGLEELGIIPTSIETRWEWELKPFRAHAYYMEEVGEFPRPKPPLPVVEED